MPEWPRFKRSGRSSRTLLLLGFFLGVGLPCFAQFDLDFSVAPSLTPALTDSNSNTALPTTLSPDLLAPQRTFVYDATGSNILASDLDPSLRVDLLGAETETDTGIRDSTQTGQISPYGATTSRLSTLFSGEGSTNRAGNTTSPLDSIPATTNYLENWQTYGTDSASTSAGSTPSGAASGEDHGSSWGGRPSRAARAGAGSGAASSSQDAATGASLASGYQSGSSLASTQDTAITDLYRSRPNTGIGWRMSELTVSRPPGEGITTIRSREPLTFAAASTDRFIARPGQIPGQNQDPYAPVSTGTETPATSHADQELHFSHDTSFAARADSDTSPGSSPFRSFGDTDFLQPDILGASRISSSASQASSASQRRRPQTTASDLDNPLGTSASGYGLKSIQQSSKSRSSHEKHGRRIDPNTTGDDSISNGLTN
jgi:hypothetical protein